MAIIHDGETFDSTDSAYGIEGNPWSYILCRTRTGARIAKLEPLDPGSWQRRLGYKGVGTSVFKVSQSATPDRPEGATDTTALWRIMRPAEVTLIVSYEGQPVYAGLVWKALYRRATGMIDITHEDVWSLWERRLAIPQHLYNAETPVIRTVQDYQNLSLVTHAKRVIQMGLIGPRTGLPGYQVPIALPADQSGSYRMVHWTYDFATVADRLMEITEMDTGPHIDFPVEWNGGAFRWRLDAFTERTERMVLHYTAHDTPVTDMEYGRDMSEYFTEVHVTGEGSETGTLHRRRWLSEGSLGEHRVALGSHDSMGHLKTGPMVQEVADGLLRERIRATEQIQCAVRVGGETGISPHDLRLGMTIVLRGTDDPVIPRGDLERTLIGFSPKGTDQLTLELAPPPVSVSTVTD